MLNFTTLTLRLFGLFGILGAILFMCGDLLYNHIPGSKDNPTVKMSKMPAARLLNAGTFGLIGCWFYTLASLHIFLGFRPIGEIFAFILALVFAIVMICYGIAHTAYFAIPAGAKMAEQAGMDAGIGGKLGNTFFQRLVFITYVPVAIASMMMFYGIVTGRSMYPRWMVLFLPIILYILKAPITRLLKGRLGEIVNDCYDNLVLFVFFVLSTLVLWNGMLS